MHVLRTLATVLALAASAAPAWAEVDAETLLRELSADSAHVRRRSLRRLQVTEGVTAPAVLSALGAARDGGHDEAVPELLALAGALRFAEVADAAAEIARGDDPILAEAAIRCLVMVGPESAERGLALLRPAEGEEPDPVVAGRRTRLRALALQDAVESDLLLKWRRKGGTYEGRFSLLDRHGWAVQPVLFAMLLDVPLEDRFLAVPEDREPTFAERYVTLREVLRSPRRGYRTFRPLPVEINEDDLFDLSAQALMDVADIDVLGQPLDSLAQRLEDAHNRYQFTIGFQLRPWEDMFAQTLGEILAAHDRKGRLAQRASRLEAEARSSLRWALRVPEDRRARRLQFYATDLSRLAGVLHRMREFDRAAAVYEESIRVSTELSGQAPAIASYNRACALARSGRNPEAIAQLDKALATDITDLTREWVEEDGDLRSLRDLPEFQKILDRYFGGGDEPDEKAETDETDGSTETGDDSGAESGE